MVILFLLILFGAPAILSTQWGQSRILGHINAQIPGKMTAKRISLSWQGDQKMESIALHDPDGNLVLTCESILLEIPLKNLFVSPTKPQFKACVEGLNATIIQDSHGITNLERTLGDWSVPLNLSSNHPQLPYAIALKDVEGQIFFAAKEKPLIVRFSGTTDDGEQKGSFAVNSELSGFSSGTLHQLKAHFVNLPVDLLDQFLIFKNPEWKGILRSALGKSLSLTIDQNRTEEGMGLTLHLESPNLTGMLQGILTDDYFRLIKPGRMSFVLMPECWNLLASATDLKLENIVQGIISLNSLYIPLNDPASTTFEGDLSFPRAAFDRLILDGIHAELKKKNSNSLYEMKIIGETKYKDVLIPFALNGSFDSISKNYETTLVTQSVQLPAISGLGSFALQDAKLHLRDSYLDHRQMLLTARLSPLTKNNLFEQPIPIRFTVDPTQDFHIATGTLEIDYLALNPLNSPSHAVFQNLKMPWRFDCKKDSLNFSFNADTLHLQNGQPQIASVLTGQIELTNWLRELKLSAQKFNRSPSFKTLEFNIHARPTDPNGRGLAASGKWNAEQQIFLLRSNFNQLPLKSICYASGISTHHFQKIEAVLGSTISGQTDIQLNKMNGSVKASISGPHGLFHLDGHLNQGFLTLNAPLYAEVEATPLFSERILEGIAPILGGMIRADDRLRLKIEPEGFQIPLMSRELSHAQVGQVSIDLGKVYFEDSSQVANILSLLKIAPQEENGVWLTPIYLTVQNGIVHFQRFDMLALDRYPLAAWGTIDLLENYVNMRVGLSGRSLQQAFGIIIPTQNYMMQFPLTGPIGHTRIDKSKAMAKIAALTAGVAGGPHGLVLGTVIGLASGAFNEEEIPPPTTNPLPWRMDAEMDGEQASTSNPIKAVQKGAGNLLKKLFGGGKNEE